MTKRKLRPVTAPKPKLCQINAAFDVHGIVKRELPKLKSARALVMIWLDGNDDIFYSRTGYNRDQVWLMSALRNLFDREYF